MLNKIRKHKTTILATATAIAVSAGQALADTTTISADIDTMYSAVDPSTLVKDVTRGMILQHLKNQTQELTGYAANKDRKHLIAAWNWGLKYIEQFPSGNPCFVDRFPEKRLRRYVPPESDFWKVLASVEDKQDRAMLLSYLHMAARRNEIFQLRWEDIDFGEQQIRLYTRKRKDGSS